MSKFQEKEQRNTRQRLHNESKEQNTKTLVHIKIKSLIYTYTNRYRLKLK